MTAQAHRARGRRMTAIHPGIVLVAIWALVIPAWYFASGDVLAASISGERAGSTHAYLFFLGCLIAFLAGSVAGGLPFGASRPRDFSNSSYPGVPLVARWCTVAVLLGGTVWLARIIMIAGSPGALIDLFLSGHSVIALKTAVFNPAQLPPITTLVHLSPAAASMLLVSRKLSGWSWADRALMLALVILTLVRTFMLAERIAGLGVAAAVAVTLILTAEDLKPRRVIVAGAAGLALLWFAWSAGEFTRSYMDKTRDDGTHFALGEFRESLAYSQDRLGAYLFTAINNGLIIVDEWPGQQFPANFAPVVARSGIPALNGEVGAGDLYTNELSREFTGESMPGKFYLDARDLGIILALAYGVVFGLAWRAAALGSPAGIVLYAALAHVLIDSYRSAYLFDLQGAAGFVGAGLMLLGAARLRSRSSPAPPEFPQLRSGRHQALLGWNRAGKKQSSLPAAARELELDRQG